MDKKGIDIPILIISSHFDNIYLPFGAPKSTNYSSNRSEMFQDFSSNIQECHNFMKTIPNIQQKGIQCNNQNK